MEHDRREGTHGHPGYQTRTPHTLLKTKVVIEVSSQRTSTVSPEEGKAYSFATLITSVEIFWPSEVMPKIFMCPSLSIAVILDRGAGVIAPLASLSRPSSHHPRSPLTGKNYADVAFYRGKIFTVTHLGELIPHYLFSNEREIILYDFRSAREKLMKSCLDPDKKTVDNTIRHLAVSANKEKLLMVQWSIPRRRANDLEVHDHQRAMDLHVFEADLAKGEWSEQEVKDLGGQSLFVSRSCSRAFSSMEQPHPRFPQGNLVYILGIDWHQKKTAACVGPCKCRECRDHVDGGIPSYCVYDMTTGTVN